MSPGRSPAASAGEPGATATTRGAAHQVAGPGYGRHASIASTLRDASNGCSGRAAGVLRRRRDGHQGAGVDGPQLRAARLLLPRDRPQPADRRALRAPGRGVRRRHRRRARRAARSCCRPTARRPRSSPPPGPGAATSSTRCARSSPRSTTRSASRAGKGYRIVYVGHEGHEEAVGTMAVAPDAISRVESVAEVEALPRLRRAGRPAGPDDAVAPRLGRRRRRRARALPRRLDAGPQRPLLRHHQPAVGADGAGRPAATPSSSSARPTRRTPGRSRSSPARPGARSSPASTPPTRSRRRSSTSPSSASPPARRRRTSSSRR